MILPDIFNEAYKNNRLRIYAYQRKAASQIAIIHAASKPQYFPHTLALLNAIQSIIDKNRTLRQNHYYLLSNHQCGD